MKKKGNTFLWGTSLVILAVAVYVLISGINTDLQRIEIIDDANLLERISSGLFEDDTLESVTENVGVDMDGTLEEAVVELQDDHLESVLDGSWTPDNGDVFFVDYRIQRDKVRGREMELLKELISNREAGNESRKEAEQNLLNLVDVMEKELLIENILKGQGFSDALFFYRLNLATVMLKSSGLNDGELAKVAEVVSGIVGVDREAVQVLVYN